jgi:hypothetical protein
MRLANAPSQYFRYFMRRRSPMCKLGFVPQPNFLRGLLGFAKPQLQIFLTTQNISLSESERDRLEL